MDVIAAFQDPFRMLFCCNEEVFGTDRLCMYTFVSTAVELAVRSYKTIERPKCTGSWQRDFFRRNQSHVRFLCLKYPPIASVISADLRRVDISKITLSEMLEEGVKMASFEDMRILKIGM